MVDCTAVDQERSARDLVSPVSGPISTIWLLVSPGRGEAAARARGAD